MREFFRIIDVIEFGTAHERDATADEILMEVGVRVSRAVRCDEQVSSLKIRRGERNELDLHRPLTQLAGHGRRCSAGCRFGFALSK